MPLSYDLTYVARGVLIFALAAAVIELVRRILLRRAENKDGPDPAELSDLAIKLLAGTHALFIGAVALAVTAQFVHLPVSSRALRAAIVLVVLFQLASWGTSAIGFALTRYSTRRNRPEDAGALTTMHALGMLARIALWVVIALVGLATFGVNVTALIAGFGIGGIAVALAAQNILGDLFGALSIALDKPFVIGDLIELDSYVGRVEHIGLRSTRLRSLTGEQIIVANGDILRSRIRNYRDVGNSKRPPAEPAGASRADESPNV